MRMIMVHIQLVALPPSNSLFPLFFLFFVFLCFTNGVLLGVFFLRKQKLRRHDGVLLGSWQVIDCCLLGRCWETGVP